MKMVAESLEITVPPFKAPVVCLRSLNPLPQFPVLPKRKKLSISGTVDVKSEEKDNIQSSSLNSTTNEHDCHERIEDTFLKRKTHLKQSILDNAQMEIKQEDCLLSTTQN